MRYKILSSVTNYTAFCSKGIELLRSFGCEITATDKDRPYSHKELIKIIEDYDAAIVGVDTWNDEIFAAAPKLKVLARFGIGVDNIDLKAAGEYGIRVTNCRGINSNSVAEHTIALMLSLIRRIPQLDKGTRNGIWERVIFKELGSCSVGLIGFGGIAQKVACKLKAFGASVNAFDVSPDKEVAETLGVKICSFEDVLDNDIISLHVPLLPETRHLINTDTILKMKDGAFLINTARGSLVDEQAVSEELKKGMIAGYATDVFETDPVNPDNPLLLMDNFICTPHIAAESYETYEQTGIVTAKAVIDVLSGKNPSNLLV